MPKTKALWTRLLGTFRETSDETEINAELESHIQLHVDDAVLAGVPAPEARRQALIQLGGMEQTKVAYRERQILPSIDSLRRDVRYTLRTFRRDAGFTAIAILILALGIGANIIVFSLVNTILLRPLPFYQQDRLVWMQPQKAGSGLSGATYSVDAFEDLRDMNHSFSAITGYFAFNSPDNMRLTGGGIPIPASSIPVVGNFFHELGVAPELGRDFTTAEYTKGAAPVAMLSHAYWERQFQADPNIVGKSISMDDAPMTIVGVLPASFDFGAIFAPGTKVDLFTPQILDDIRTYGNTLTLLGRLNPGVTLGAATAETTSLFPQFYWGKRVPTSKGSYGPVTLVPIKEHVAGQLRRSLYVLWAAVAMILLIVCVNLSNLLIARAAARSKEFALRIALGADRAELVRLLLTESLVLSTFGAMLGLVGAYAVTSWLAHQGSVALPLLSSLRVDGYVLGWTLFVAIFASLLFGLVPGLKLSSGNLQESLKDSGQNSSDSRKHEGLRTTLVVSEVALACVLIVGAGLLLRSFMHILDIDLGFQPTHASAIKLDVLNMNVPRDMRDQAQTAFFRNVVETISSVPGITSVGIADALPFSRNRSWGPPGLKGVTYPRPDPRPSPFIFVVSPGYFATMGAHLRGREFAWTDTPKSELGMIVNQKIADFFFPNQDALNRMISFQGKDVRIIGIVPDMHETNLESDAGWQVYLPISQGWGPNDTHLIVRSSFPSSAYYNNVMQKLRAINPGQPRSDFFTIQSLVDHATSPRRFFAMLVGIFAALGLILASLGIYGVISYAVTRQTQEIGIRMALGASRERVQLSVIQRTLRLALIGVAAGTAASLVVAKAISSLLFGVEALDPLTFIAMIVLLTAVALVAGYIPARRASQVNPMLALRNA